ncbi:hypothetical protein SOCE26_020690 [Sorangium cellulosum]|uniref:Intradiol ring-cleavage dioxygenases domain-containing protein n=1 Tax=Sorangium cellulosum TaxID=56 RepID=A0A2L0EN04_SORCE|nr:hypothetical protein [Sorangium cellulosum]AUX40668.1 hypothetical protein SOCE26_020690 [Sorangium cellulosum]
MSKERDTETQGPSLMVVDRRQALLGLGAIAVTVSCGDGGESNPNDPSGAGGSGGSGASGTTGSGTGGTGPGPATTSASGSGGAGPGATTTTTGSGGSGAGGMGGGGGGDGLLTAPPFDNVPTCRALNKTDGAGQGPFFIHELEKNDDISLIRQDIRGRYNESAEPGVEMHLHLRVLDMSQPDCDGTGVGLPDVDVYIWHTDAQGFYSGFGARGSANEQNPDSPYAGRPNQNNLDTNERFCRGVQTTDANGVVSFRSIFPGWYNGRDVHIHFVCFKKGSMSRGRMNYSGGDHIFTTQFYFDPAFTDSVHTTYEPYKARTMGNLANYYAGAIKADEAGNSGLRAKAVMEGDIVIAQMQIAVNPT